MTYGHVVDPQLSPADFPGLAYSPRFAGFPGKVVSLELQEFQDLVDFLQEAPAEVVATVVSVVRLAMLLLVTLCWVWLFY